MKTRLLVKQRTDKRDKRALLRGISRYDHHLKQCVIAPQPVREFDGIISAMNLNAYLEHVQP